jgi:hypothetical protein
MSVKAVAGDEVGTQHFIIGLNREDIKSLLKGDVLTLSQGFYPKRTDDSDVVLLFAETDQDIGKRFPPGPRPASASHRKRKRPPEG